MKAIRIVFFSFILLYSSAAMAQNKTAQGFFTSEAKAAVLGSNIIVSIKRYNPTEEEIRNATKPSRNAPMTYLQIPFGATNISMYERGFESSIYCYNTEGNLLWDRSIGYSNRSVANAVKTANGYIYTGASDKNADKVTIQKLSAEGKTIWQTTLDSLDHLEDLFIANGKVNVLVSFDARNKVQHKNGTFSENVYPIYHYVQLDENDGKQLVKDYQAMSNYLSSLGFAHPYMNTRASYYLNNSDSAIFLNATQQTSATIVSEGMSKDNKIVALTAGETSNHLLTVLSKGRSKVYNLITDFYGDKIKYQSEIPATYTDEDRRFILKNDGDSIITVIASPTTITVATTDKHGKSVVTAETKTNVPLTGITLLNNKIVLVQVEGREKPGTPGVLLVKSL